MTVTVPAASPRAKRTRWLYPTLAVTGIAVGIFVILAGVYLLFVHPSSGHASQPDCCKSMEADMKKMMGDPDMKKMMGDPKMPMNQPAMPPMSSMPPSMPPMSQSMSPMPGMSPTPGMSPMPGMPAPTHTP